MRDEPAGAESRVVAAAPSAHAMTTEATTGLPRFALARPRWLTTPPIAVGRRGGWIALSVLLLATLAVVAYASSGPTVLVPRSVRVFPNWEAGPLHYITSRPLNDRWTLDLIFSFVLVAMLIAYGIAMAAIRSLTMRSIVIVVLILHLILLLSPPLQLSDIFNYMGYARLGALHHISPYTHGISSEHFDPIFQFASWDNLKSPYGELFTAVSYPLAFLPLPVAFWVIKVVVVLLSLGFLSLVWWCAIKLGRDPRFVVGFVALNPIYLLYAVAGFHNDFLMLVASMAAIAFVLSGRDRWAGAALVVGGRGQVHGDPARAVPAGRRRHASAIQAAGDRRADRGDPAGGAERHPVRDLAAQPPAAELADHRAEHPEPRRAAAARRRRDVDRAGPGRPVRRRGRAVLLPAPARLAGRGRVVDAWRCWSASPGWCRGTSSGCCRWRRWARARGCGE